MSRFIAFALSVVCFSLTVAAESRFGRTVLKLSEPKEYGYFKLDDNNFPFLDKGPISVTCMTYRGSKRYYVEIGVANHSPESIMLEGDFVAFSKPAYTVYQSDTLAAAADVWTSASGTFTPAPPPPPPTQSRTTYSGTAQTYGNSTMINGTATTTEDNSAAGWNALGNAIGARRFYKAQSRDQSFAVYLQTFATASRP